jgi:hypothetical protein
VRDTDRGPFRRFPWVQLVFCVACLGAAAWLLLAYSYCWDVTDRFLLMDGPSLGLGTLAGRYVEVRKRPDSDISWSSTYYCDVAPYGEHALPRDVVFVEHDLRIFNIITHMGEGSQASSRPGWRGRVVPLTRGGYAIDTTRSRLHPASAAGLVVGAMGAFIFGLYLRRWLREREALARLPGRDMIA